MHTLTKTQNKSLDLAVTLLGSTLFLFLCAKCKLYTTLSPVPVTMHTLAILVLGSLLPFSQSIICFSAFFTASMLGIPFLSVPILYAAMGYYVGMAVALYFLSKTVNKLPLMLSMPVASLLIFGFGVLHLQSMMGLKNALMVGVAPFLVGDVLKLLIAYAFVTGIRKKLNSTTV